MFAVSAQGYLSSLQRKGTQYPTLDDELGVSASSEPSWKSFVNANKSWLGVSRLKAYLADEYQRRIEVSKSELSRKVRRYAYLLFIVFGSHHFLHRRFYN